MIRIPYVIILLLLVTLGCKRSDPIPNEKESFRTVLIYIAANNNLSNEAYDNIDQLENHIGEVDGNLLVYAKLPNVNPALYRISNSNGLRKKEKIKEYTNHNSSDPTVLRQVINEVYGTYKSSSYGLILWSHATGWVPADIGPIKLKSFGSDNGDEMDIKELNSAIPPNIFDFIMFDACSMASLEVLYEIKDKAKYIIASPGEVVSNGMPYSEIVNNLFDKGREAYITIAEKYFQHYNNLSGNYRSATISIIETEKLNQIASATKQILENQTSLNNDFKRDQIQRMDFDRYSNPLIAFDFLDFMKTNYVSYATLESAINSAVIYKANTPYFNGYVINKNCGLTCYIPHMENEDIVHDYYKTLKWYSASGFNFIF